MQSIFERFTNPATMIEVEQELLALGEGAAPILEKFFSGEARDSSGVPWRARPLPLRCAIEVAARLGPLTKPLEPWLRREVDAGSFPAAMALGCLKVLDEASVASLANALTMDSHGFDLLCEAATALARCGHANHPLVTAALASSEKAAWQFERTRKFLTGEHIRRTSEQA